MIKNNFFKKNLTLNIKGTLYELTTPIVMGILNVTPDSFFDGGKYTEDDLIYKRVSEMIEEGVDIIDVGAVSTRPGSKDPGEKEEKNRLIKALEIIRKKYPNILLSVDTFRSSIAEFVVKEYDVNVINDITAGRYSDNMFMVIATLNVPYIMMHMKGTPETMQINPTYDDVIFEIVNFFKERIFEARKAGIKDIIIDPGFGFGKTLEHNYIILNNLEAFDIFELPIMIGVSRKSMVYKLLGVSPEFALNGTTVIHTIALIKNVSILRVHDVKEAKEIIKILEFLKKCNQNF